MTTEIATQEFEAPAEVTPVDIMLNVPLLAQIDAMAERMANANATIPKHLQKNTGDCWAVIMQAVQWRMNPFAVAQKTHVTKSGVLGYEAQLINAAITSLAPISDRPEFEFIGDWSKILGKVEEKTSQKGGKYYVAAWQKADEDGLGVKCSCTLRGEDKPREVTIMLSQCYPRFSTQWATDPQQQITYVAVRKWARRYTPDVILGVYTPEEMQEAEGGAGEREVGPGARSSLNDALDEAKPEATAAEPIEGEIVEAEAEPAEELPPGAKMTFAQVTERISGSPTDADLQDLVLPLIGQFLGVEKNKKFRDEINDAYKARRRKLAEAAAPAADAGTQDNDKPEF